MEVNFGINNRTSFAGKYKDRSYITDPSGRFYAGMTIQEARLDGTDKCVWRRDFYNLDKNADGVLSVEEIFDERNRSLKWHKISAGIFSGLAVLDAFLPTGKEKVISLLLDAIIIASDLKSIHNISKTNERYERMLAENNGSNNISYTA